MTKNKSSALLSMPPKTKKTGATAPGVQKSRPPPTKAVHHAAIISARPAIGALSIVPKKATAIVRRVAASSSSTTRVPLRPTPLQRKPAAVAAAPRFPATLGAASAPRSTLPLQSAPHKWPQSLRTAIASANTDPKAARAMRMQAAYAHGDPNWKYVNRPELPKSRPKDERDKWRQAHTASV